MYKSIGFYNQLIIILKKKRIEWKKRNTTVEKKH